MDWLIDTWNEFTAWLYSALVALGEGLVNAVLFLPVLVLESLPVPDFLNSASLTIPGTVSFWVGPFQLDYGLTVCLSAYVARFLLRRIPGIG